MRMNLPNQITTARFFMAIALFIILSIVDVRHLAGRVWMLDVATLLFILAALSDALDGYLARKHNQVTSFGRVLDPFADKLLVVGTFVLLLGRGFIDEAGRNVSGLAAWMVVIIVARELLVSGLRGFSEADGTPYAANYWGKIKMVVQSITVPVILLSVGRLAHLPWFVTLRDVMVWVTVVATAISVVGYLVASRSVFADRARD